MAICSNKKIESIEKYSINYDTIGASLVDQKPQRGEDEIIVKGGEYIT